MFYQLNLFPPLKISTQNLEARAAAAAIDDGKSNDEILELISKVTDLAVNGAEILFRALNPKITNKP